MRIFLSTVLRWILASCATCNVYDGTDAAYSATAVHAQ
jgi:hypothetical protein